MQKIKGPDFPKRKWVNGSKQTHSTYRVWTSMRHHCHDPKVISYSYYGAKGISVCQRWLDSYDDFIEDMGLRPKGLTLDRINSKGNYEPGNCQWASVTEQNRNKSDTRRLTFSGKTQSLAEWAREYGLLRATLAFRLKTGVPLGIALTAPVVQGNNVRVGPTPVLDL